MSYDVLLTYETNRSSVSMVASRWCEFNIGDMWDDWQSEWSKHQPDEEVFHFKYRLHAEQFQKVFARPVRGHLIVPFNTYRYFWINHLGRVRIDNTFAEKGWTPQVVVPSDITLHRKRKLDGERVLFRRNVGWFFEKERDALLFLLFDIGEGND